MQAEAPRVGELLVEHAGVPAQVVQAALGKQKAAEERRASGTRSVKVPADRLDALIDQVGELVIASAATSCRRSLGRQTARRGDRRQPAAPGRGRARRRAAPCMTPIGEVFNRFPRVVRDLAREARQKDIELVIPRRRGRARQVHGREDRRPLMHLVRNAPRPRHPSRPNAAPPGGQTGARPGRAPRPSTSRAASSSRSPTTRRLDARRIPRQGRQRPRPGRADAVLSETEIHRLVLAPGFSTAAELTSLSGRGVGMDVVKSSVDALRGTLDIHGAPGQGTTMRLCLPLTLAIIDGFPGRVSGATFILPLDAVVTVHRTSRPTPAPPATSTCAARSCPSCACAPCSPFEGAPPPRQNVVVVRFGGRQAGIAVDHLLGECRAVIKPLGPLFERVAGIAGSTILGSGEVALILDVPQLVQRAIAHEGRDTGVRRGRASGCMNAAEETGNRGKRMFRNMKVGVKLGLGFGLVLVLLGTLLAVGILRLTDIKHDVDVVVDELWPKTQLLQDGLVGVNRIALGRRASWSSPRTASRSAVPGPHARRARAHRQGLGRAPRRCWCSRASRNSSPRCSTAASASSRRRTASSSSSNRAVPTGAPSCAATTTPSRCSTASA